MKPPPEERLLRLIRGKKPSAGPAAPAAPGGGAPLPALTRRSFLRSRGTRVRSLRWLAASLGGLLVVELVWLVVQLASPLPTIPTPSNAAPPPPPPGSLRAGELLQDLPSLAASAPRTLFAAPAVPVPVAVTTPPPKTGPSGSVKLLSSRLTLMGIVAGDSPQAIIEDSETKKTYFVTTGQAIAEGAVLEKVFDNRVILDLNGEKIELTL